MRQNKNINGELLYKWAKDIFPFNRSLSGKGVRETLGYIQKILPSLQRKEFISGTKVFDWTIPPEWEINEAYIESEKGEIIADFSVNNLHVLGYSSAIDKWMSFEELNSHLFSLPEQPNAIPYVTSYYQKEWGFCLTDNQRKNLDKNLKYRAVIKSQHRSNGVLNYGELYIKGKSSREIVFSTYICHPSMANNEVSGICLSAGIASWIQQNIKSTNLSYRFIFIPETIGSIAYIRKNLDKMRKNVEAGFVLSCVGDDRDYSYVASRYGNNIADRAALHVLKHIEPNFKRYSFLDRGSDERQFCSPGIDLPFCTLSRSKFAQYPEYHTSLDNLDLISPNGLNGSLNLVIKLIEVLEHNSVYKTRILCEPQMGKRGLYSHISRLDSATSSTLMMNCLAYCDGKNDLINIAEILSVPAWSLIDTIKLLVNEKIIAPTKRK